MVESLVCNFYIGGAAAAVGSSCCWRTPLRSDCITHLGLNNLFHGYPIRIQRISTCKLHSICCNSLRLGAAEEGVSSWADKLESTASGKDDLLVEDESDTVWRDRIVDEEGNIDNIEQEQTRSPCEDEAASEQWPNDQEACLDDMSARDQDQGRPQHNIRSEVNSTFKNSSQQTMEGPGSVQSMDWSVMTERGPISSLSSTSNLWTGEDGIKEGDKGEAIVENVHVFPSHSQGEVSPTRFQGREKYGSSEATCDKGSLSRMNPHEHGRGKAMQEDKLQEEEEEVFQEDDGRTPDDYQRRADLFNKSGEQFVAQKQRDERKSV